MLGLASPAASFLASSLSAPALAFSAAFSMASFSGPTLRLAAGLGAAFFFFVLKKTQKATAKMEGAACGGGHLRKPGKGNF